MTTSVSDANVTAVSFSHTVPDEHVDYEQFEPDSDAPGAQVNPPFTAPPAHLAPAEDDLPESFRPAPAQRSARRGGGNARNRRGSRQQPRKRR